MSNLSEKPSPKLPQLTQTYLKRETPCKDADVENNFCHLGLSSAKKNLDEFATDVRKKVTMKPKPSVIDESEYINTLKNSLKEAMDENDKLRSRVTELESLLVSLDDDREARDRAILELAGLLEAQNVEKIDVEKSPVQKRGRSSSNNKDRRRSKSNQ